MGALSSGGALGRGGALGVHTGGALKRIETEAKVTTLRSIPPVAGEVVRALIEVGGANGVWYSRHAGQDIGRIVEGELQIAPDITLSRIWSARSNQDTDFRINSTGAGSLSAWFWGAGNLSGGRANAGDAVAPPFGPGYGRSLRVHFDGRTYAFDHRRFRNGGGAWYNFMLDPGPLDVALDSLPAGTLVNVVL